MINWGNSALDQTNSQAAPSNTNPAAFDFRPDNEQQAGLGRGQGAPASGTNLGAPSYPDPGQLFASQHYAPRPPPQLHPHIRQSLMQGQQQGASLPSDGPGGNTAVPSPWVGGHPTAVASSGLQGPAGAGAGAGAGQVGPDTSGRRPKRPQVSQELIEGVAAAVEEQSGPPAKRKKVKDEYSALRAWIHREYITPKIPAGNLDSKTAKFPCPICQKKTLRSSMNNHILSKHLPDLKGVIPEEIRPKLYECSYEGCSALRGNYRADALSDHEHRVHGIDVPEKRYSTEWKYVRRKYPGALRGHNIIDGRDLNALKERVREAERQLAERLPHYESRHGLDLDTTYPTEEAALQGKSPATLIEDLINLRTDGSKKGKLLCRPGKDGTWKEVVEDLETALMRSLDGQAINEGEGEAEGEGEDEGEDEGEAEEEQD